MKTLILIPGLLSDHIVWQSLAKLMTSQMHIYNADLTQSESITQMAQTIIDDVNGEFIVVGHSLGGRVAMEIARMVPNRLKGLVLANTGHMPKRDGEEIKRQTMIDLGHTSMDELAEQWLPPMLNPAAETSPELLASLKAMVLRANANIHERQIKALIARPDASQYLNQINCPTLLLVGRQDGWSPIAQHQAIAQEIKNSKLAIIENAGHFAPVEQETEVALTISNWIKKINK